MDIKALNLRFLYRNLLFLVIVIPYLSFSQIVTPFNIRYQANQKGGILLMSNVALTCNSNNANCGVYQQQLPPNGNHNQDGGITMGYVDVDFDASTWMSSSDSLNLPDCSEVSWAGLYWSARITTTTTNYATRNQVRIKRNNGLYQTLTADQLLNVNSIAGNPGFNMRSYYCFKDITSIVQAANGHGRFTIANIVSQTGDNNLFGAWSIIVVYKNQLQSMRNLTVFDGMAYVSNGNTLDIPISGFVTPQVGPVSFELGIVAHEGDRSIPGDRLQFNGNGTFLDVPDPIRSANDFFNSTLTYNGALSPFRKPSYNNTLGFDTGIFFPNNSTQSYIGNNATSATVRVTTSQDAILPRVITSAIDIYEPDLRATVYINDLNGAPAQPNDILEYTVVAKNIGSDVSLNTFLTDTLDIRTNYIPNSISYLNGPFIGAKTDAAADDQAEYDPVNRIIRARVNSGASATQGGTMNNSPTGADSAVVRFRVRVVDDCIILSCDSTLENKAYLFGTGVISGNSYNNGGASDMYDANGCPSSSSNLISVFAPNCPDIAVSYNGPICVGNTLDLSVPVSSYANYSWTGPNGFTSTEPNPSISDITNEMAGVYSLTITLQDASCSYQNLTDTIVVNTPPDVNLNYLNNVLCFNASNGSIQVSGSGNSPFTYSWLNTLTNTTFSSNNTLSNLSPGTYIVTVTDVNTCITKDTFTVNQPTDLLASATITSNYNGKNISCFGAGDGSANVSFSGGTAPYSVSWSNGATSAAISNLGPGTYTATITDANGCVKTTSVTLTQPTAITLSDTKVMVSCFGGSNASINLTASGGTPGYSYSWSNGSTTEDLANLVTGTYNVQVTDLNGCTKTRSVVITQPVVPLTLNQNHINVSCYGNSTGSIDLTVTGGTLPYNYSWSNSSTTQDISGLSSGTYNVVVTDGKGCTANTSVIITQPLAPLYSTVLISDVSCYGGTNGFVNLSPSGGTSPYTFLWNNGITTEDISALNNGNYSVTITDSKGCVATNSALVSQPITPLGYTFFIDNPNCFGGNDGSINLSVSGGTVPYNYNWSNGQNTEDLNSLVANNYLVTITDFNGCQLVEDTILVQPSQIQISFQKTDVKCYGQSTGSIDLTVIGGTPSYHYSWSNSLTNEDINVLISGTYSVSVTDSLGCLASESIVIQQPLAPLILSENHTDAVCLGAQQGTIDLTVNGGTAPYFYNWNNNQTTQDVQNLVAGYYYCVVSDNNQCVDTIGVTILDPSNNMVLGEAHTNVSCKSGNNGSIELSVIGGTPGYTFNWSNSSITKDLTNLFAGNYFVTVTDLNSCQSFISVYISEPPLPLSINYQNQNVLCYGFNTGLIDVTVTGGTPNYAYAWNNGSNQQDLSNLFANSYDLSVTDSMGCIIDTTVLISQPNEIVISETHSDVSCFGGSNGSIDISVSGGVGTYTYSWSNNSNLEDLSTLVVGNYTLIVTDANNCSKSLTIIIAQPSAPLTLSASLTNVSCNSGNNGSINITPNGGNGSYQYIWNNSSNTEDIQNLVSGTYSVTITDIKNCTATANYQITQPALPLSLSITSTPVICFGQSNGTATVIASGGTPGYAYAWSNGQTASNISGLIAGTYSLIVTDNKLCNATASVIVQQPNLLVANADSVDVLCFGNSTGSAQVIASGGVMPYSYLWNTNSINASINNLISGIYTVSVTDFNGCTANSVTTVNQPPNPLQISFVTSNNVCFGASTGSINATVIGGTPPYNYAWSNSQSTEDISLLPTGNYQLNISDNHGCTLSNNTFVNQPTQINTIAQISSVNCFGGNDGSINISVSGGVAPYQFQWSNGETTEDIFGLTSGSYTVIISDSNDCQRSFVFNVPQPLQPLTLSSIKTDVGCFGASTGAINLSVIGGTSPYLYNWSNNQMTQDINNLSVGTYSVIVEDNNHCFDSLNITISQPQAPLHISESHVDILCFGSSTGSIDATVIGGTSNYNYNWSNSSTSQDISNISSGNYQLIVTDNNGCKDTLVVVIQQPVAPIDIQFVVQDVGCFSDTTATIMASISGGTPNYTWQWNTGQIDLFIDSLPIGAYVLSVTDSNNCSYSETAIVNQPTALSASYSEIQPTCYSYSNGQLLLTPSGGTVPYNFSWSNGDVNQNSDSLTAGNYNVEVTDSHGCTFDLSCILNQPDQLSVSFDADLLVGCSPLTVNFQNTSDPSVSCLWNFGDGNSYMGCTDIVNTFEQGGLFDVYLVIVDANGCTNNITYNDFITVNQTPVADFNVAPQQLFPESQTANITNLSTGGDWYIWNLGDETSNHLYFEPGEHTYPINIADTFLITLYASTTEGCADTATRIILFNNDPFYFAPNTFIPDNDGTNDVWLPVFSNPDKINRYSLQIFDRWGELIFETDNTSSGWDGTINNGILKAQDGTYVWKLQFTWYDYKVYNTTGHINLLR